MDILYLLKELGNGLVDGVLKNVMMIVPVLLVKIGKMVVTSVIEVILMMEEMQEEEEE